MHRIILLEDSPEIQAIVQASLSQIAHIEVAQSIAEARHILNKGNVDLLLADVMLPDGSGFDLCEDLKRDEKNQQIPVIFLTQKTETKDKVFGFEIGAEDYVVKPFDPCELRARVQAKFKSIEVKSKVQPFIIRGNLKIDILRQKAVCIAIEEEKELDLTPNEFRLLFYFFREDNRILNRDDILSFVWGDSTGVTDRTVDTHVCTLRKKLGSCAHYVESVYGSGYRFSSKNKSSLV